MINSTRKVPTGQVRNFKRTKIYASIGPATDSYELVYDMIKAGVNCINMNFSHGANPERERQIKWIRRASREIGKPVAVVQDLQGPKIRLGDFEGTIPVSTGQMIRLGYKTNYEETGVIPVQYDLSTKVKRGDTMYIFDGKVRATIESVKEGIIHAHVENNGELLQRKGINLPDTDFGGDVITKKDKADLAFGSTQDFDYVAMSFIQTAADAVKMRQLMHNLNYNAKLIAKVETKAAIDNIEAIVQEVDAVMIARGDLAYEVTPEAVPVIQRKIIGLCLKHGRLSIVATQMLGSMTENPEPTRAEVSDVATSVVLQADALALRDETAMGKYPIEAVKMMKRIILYTESHSPLRIIYDDPSRREDDHPTGSMQVAIAKAVITLADKVDARAIVVETKSGATAVQIAANRPKRPIIAVSSTNRVVQQLAMLYGTKTYLRRDERFQASKLTHWLQESKVLNKDDIVVTCSGKYPGVVGTTDTIKVRMLE